MKLIGIYLCNKSKTEACLFYKNDQPLIKLRINNERIRTKAAMNVLGVLFDSKLQWAEQVSQTINKAKIALRSDQNDKVSLQQG